jgi:hypothetical protein
MSSAADIALSCFARVETFEPGAGEAFNLGSALIPRSVEAGLPALLNGVPDPLTHLV